MLFRNVDLFFWCFEERQEPRTDGHQSELKSLLDVLSTTDALKGGGGGRRVREGHGIRMYA